MNILPLYEIYQAYPSVQTDTRLLKPGDLFFALRGENFNGNDYAKEAFEKGAAYCVLDEEPGFMDRRCLIVEDVLETLQALAAHHRDTFTIPFIAITGSNGKTTTKELVHAVLSSKFKTYTTTGNLNNHIGIPLTLLRIRKDAEMAVIEMGANHLHEIEGYCLYTRPTHGLITNCGKAHLEGFGSEEGVRKGKGELFDWLRNNEGTAFVLRDHEYLEEMSRGIKEVIFYGTKESDSFLSGRPKRDGNFLEVELSNVTPGVIRTSLVGDYNLPNVLAAACIGKYFGINMNDTVNALENYQPSNSRSQLLKKNGNEFILDAYNANPSSMKAAIENFAHIPGENKYVVLGGMMELGEGSTREHEDLVKLLDRHKWQQVLLVGDHFRGISGKHLFFEDPVAAGKWLKEKNLSGAKVLVKGSRSMKMEKVLE